MIVSQSRFVFLSVSDFANNSAKVSRPETGGFACWFVSNSMLPTPADVSVKVLEEEAKKGPDVPFQSAEICVAAPQPRFPTSTDIAWHQRGELPTSCDTSLHLTTVRAQYDTLQ